MRPGDVLLLRPGVWHGYEDCQRFEVYNCCFSSELLRRELSWTREDPLLGFLLWAGPYSSPGRGVLTISLPPSVLGDCLVHLDALAALRHRPPALHRPDIVGRLSLLFGQLGQAVAQARGELPGDPGSAHPAVVQAMRLLEADLAQQLDADRPGRRAAPRPGLPGPAVQCRHRAASHGLPGPAPRRARRRPAPALRRAGHQHRARGRLARPEHASPAASRPTTGSAPPPTASASPPGPPICTTPPRPPPDHTPASVPLRQQRPPGQNDQAGIPAGLACPAAEGTRRRDQQLLPGRVRDLATRRSDAMRRILKRYEPEMPALVCARRAPAGVGACGLRGPVRPG